MPPGAVGAGQAQAAGQLVLFVGPQEKVDLRVTLVQGVQVVGRAPSSRS